MKMKKLIVSIILILFVLTGISFADVRDCQIDLDRYINDQQNPNIIFGTSSQIKQAKYMQFMHKGLRTKLKNKDDILTVFIYTPKNYFKDKKTFETEVIFSTFGFVIYNSTGFCIEENTLVEYIIIQNKKTIKFGYQEDTMGPAEWRKSRLKNPIIYYNQNKIKKDCEDEKKAEEAFNKEMEISNENARKIEAEKQANYKAQRDRIDKNEAKERDQKVIENEVKNVFKKLKLW